MAYGVFMHRFDSIYDDVLSEQYQFPKKYLASSRACEGNWIVYLEPKKVKNTRGYFAVARVREIIQDPQRSDMYVALMEPGTYLDFGNPVPFQEKGFYFEQGLLNEYGKPSGHRQSAVRPLSSVDFARIVARGLGKDEDILPRRNEDTVTTNHDEYPESVQDVTARERVLQLTNRAVRDRNFRTSVLRDYCERCAITGLRLINGGGAAEVQAAHIKPVKFDGPDIVSNGLALSGTAHWMFDRGLVGLSDDLTILISRQSNDPDAIRSMLNYTGCLLAPDRVTSRPRREFVAWHREHCFKN